MDYFQHVIVLVSIVIGFAITHVLSGIGTAIHPVRGHGGAFGNHLASDRISGGFAE